MNHLYYLALEGLTLQEWEKGLEEKRKRENLTPVPMTKEELKYLDAKRRLGIIK